jgi:hypothetical protein
MFVWYWSICQNDYFLVENASCWEKSGIERATYADKFRA